MEAINVPTRVAVHFTPEFMAVLDERCRSLPGLPNRAETVRRLVEQALSPNLNTNNKPNRHRRTTMLEIISRQDAKARGLR
jgi:hypothetical protein